MYRARFAWKKSIMKKSLSWRLFVLVAGTLFGLLAGMGLAAPAVASPVQVTTDGDHRGGGAHLSIYEDDDEIRVVGDDYDSWTVYVKVVRLNDHGRDRVVDERSVRAHDGDFKYSVDVRCDNSYEAYSYSKKDGWERSGGIRISCDDDGYGRH